MQLIYEEDNLLVPLHLIEYGLHSGLKLSAKFCACHYRAYVQRDYPLVVKHSGDLSRSYSGCKPLHYCALANSGFAYKHRVVLFAPAQYLCQSLYLCLPAHYGVQTPFARHLGKVCAKALKHICIALFCLLRSGLLL